MGNAPRVLGPYEILEVLGQGGMGTVYRGRHVELGVTRAIKVLLGQQTPARVERFLRETRHLAKIQHPNVVAVHDVGQAAEGQLFYAMELVEGEDLDRILTHGRLDYDRALALAIGICHGIEALHQVGVLHRDLKPANVVVRPSGEPVVLDLGLAVAPDQDQRITKTGAMLGTPHYMAPEQVRGEKATAQSDVYALGLITHELLSGYSICDSGELPGFAVLPAPSSVDGSLPRAFDQIVARALDRDPTLRFATAGGLGSALEALREAPGITRRVFRRLQLGVVCALALALAALVLASEPPPDTSGPVVRKPATRTATRRANTAPDARAAREATRELRRVVRIRALPSRHAALGEWLKANPGHSQAGAAQTYLSDARLRFPVRIRFKGAQELTGRLVCFLSNGEALSYVTEQGAIQWHVASNTELGSWDELGRLRALEAAPDGASFAVVNDRGVVWVQVNPRKIVVLAPHLAVWALGFSPDGRRLAYVFNRTLWLVDVAAKEEPVELGTFRSDRAGQQTADVVFSPDGRYVVVSGDKELGVYLWDVQARARVYHATQLSKINDAVFSPGGETFVVARGGGTVGVLGLDGPNQLGLYGAPAGAQDVRRAVRTLAFSRDGKYLHALDEQRGKGQEVAGVRRIWDVAKREVVAQIVHNFVGGVRMKLSPDGAYLLLANRSRVEVWEAGIPPELPSLDATE
jgi:hypothetical protein